MAGKKPKPDGIPRAAIKRIEEGAAARLLGPEFGTPIGQMRLLGDLPKGSYDAAVWFAQLDDGYRRAIGIPPVRSSSGEVTRGEPVDPFSELGEAKARSDRAKVRAFRDAAQAAVRGCGMSAYRAFYAVAVLDADPGAVAPTRALGMIIVRDVAEALRRYRETAGRARTAA